jgi:hypothetical protein
VAIHAGIRISSALGQEIIPEYRFRTSNYTNNWFGYQQTALDNPGGVRNKKARRSELFVGPYETIGRLKTIIWCPEEDSNLHALRH